MPSEITMTMQVDEDGWVIVPANVKMKPPLPSEGRATHIKKSPGGPVMLRQETSAGPRLWMLSADFKSWTEVEGGNA